MSDGSTVNHSSECTFHAAICAASHAAGGTASHSDGRPPNSDTRTRESNSQSLGQTAMGTVTRALSPPHTVTLPDLMTTE